LLDKAKQILRKHYGFETFKEGQEEIIKSILDGKDTFAIMPTGAGKSVCFQVPAQLLPGVTLVISPLISLMKDQVDSLNEAGISAAYINSSLNYGQIEERLQKAREGYFKLIYVAPERLESQRFRELLQSVQLSLLAVDEAHCVSQWGHDFRPSYRAISSVIREQLPRPVIAAFTATATKEVKEDAIKLLLLRQPDIFITGFDRKNLSFSVMKGVSKRDFVLNHMQDNIGKSGIIYAATRKEVDGLWRELTRRGYRAGRYHAGLSDIEREESQEAFLYDDIHVMVATNAFGMGIDKSNVRYVIHYNMPKNMEAYYQEAGRAGRDGEPSACILLFEPRDVSIQKFLIEQNTRAEERQNNEYQKLQSMVDYCHSQRCLRKYILNYFGERDAPPSCDNCSNCNDETDYVDITLDAQKIISCVVRMRERFGTTLVAQVLKGSKNRKVLQSGFDKLTTYGIMRSYTEKEIKNMINVMVAEGYLTMTGGQYPVLRLRQESLAVLKNEEKVYRRVPKKKATREVDNNLFEILRSLRKELSTKEKVPPYVVFPDGALREMSEKCPQDLHSLAGIKGVGEYKLEKYGAQFVQAINSYLAGDEN